MKHRGHEIELKHEWVYSDNNKPVSDDSVRACGFCNLAQTPEGHDGCLGTLKGGVMNACCGHGNVEVAYVQRQDGTCVRGLEAWRLIVRTLMDRHIDP